MIKINVKFFISFLQIIAFFIILKEIIDLFMIDLKLLIKSNLNKKKMEIKL